MTSSSGLPRRFTVKASMRRLTWLSATGVAGGLLWVGTGVAGAAELANAYRDGQLDLAHCGVWHNDTPAPLDAARMLFALGLRDTVDRPWVAWSAGSVKGEAPDGDTFRYRVAFTEPVTVGSVLASSREVARLKSDAPYPGNPANPAHWESMLLPDGTRPRLAVFATAAPTRALLFTDRQARGASTLGPVRVYAGRFFNPAPLAGARARSHYNAPANFGGQSYPAINVARGHGSWISSGKNSDGLITTPPVSDVHPQWIVLAWDEPRTLSGLYLRDNFADFTIEHYVGPAEITPLAGTEREWRRLRDDCYHVESQQGRWIRFVEPLQTAGIRLRVTRSDIQQGGTGQIAQMDALLAFEALGDAPAPAVRFDAPQPPFRVAYDAPQDGFLTLVVDDAEGRRVRNLFARRPRAAGVHEHAWDLLCESKARIEPGRYRWKLITGPELELHYEMSVYPNVTVHHPENTAWLNGKSGSGGWLADHTPPLRVATAGNHVFLGSPTPENGVGFAVTDLDGRKLWGIGGFAAWSAGRGMATDGTTVFVEHMGSGHYGAPDAGADRIWAVDIASRRHRHLLTAQQSEHRLRGIAAMAAREGKLYLAVNATENWLGNAAGWADVNIEHCLPLYTPARAPRRPYEIVPNARDDYLRLFRLKGDPPGYGHPGGEGLIWMESTRGPQRRQEIMLTFNRPVPIGSCVFPVPQGQDYQIRLSVLKPDADFPPRPGQRDQWIPFETHGELAWDVAIAPPGTRTRALLITFVKGEDDLFADLLDQDIYEPDLRSADRLLAAPARTTSILQPGGQAWQGRLAGMRLLRRRFRNHFGDATIQVSSGRVDRHGMWVAERTEPLSPANPAIYMMQWDEPRILRGLAIEEIDGSRAEIDVFTGPAGESIAMKGPDHWEQVGVFIPRRRMDHVGFQGHNAHALYMDGTVDFGRMVETRAVRIRVVSQWTADTREGSCARDRMGLDPTRCRIFGVAPLEYIGDEDPVDAVIAQRIEVVDGATGTIEHEVPIVRPTQLACAPDGTLFGIADGELVRIDIEHGRHEPAFATTVEHPGPMAFDRHGNLYLYDAAPARRVIHVYAPDGRPLRTIGEPGGYQAGPWNPNRFNAVTSIAVDRRDQLWVVDYTYFPKRISCWTIEGEWLRDHYGHTQYGGGGVLDPGDKRRLFYGPLEFEIDWETGGSRLKNLTRTDGLRGEVPIYLDGRTYMVTRPSGTYPQGAAIVFLHEDNRLRMVAALGRADQFAPLERADILASLGNRTLGQHQFMWTDHNGDGQVQVEEVVFEPRRIGNLGAFDRQLTIHAGSTAFEVDRFLENGAPVFRMVETPVSGTWVYRRLDGGFHVLSSGRDAGYGPDGRAEWSYPNEGMSVGPNRSAGPFTPEQVLCQFYVVGHETAAGGDLGEFFVMNANLGSWYVWTADGLLASRIFRDLRDGRRISWTMPRNERGMRLDDVTAGEEHFDGWFVRAREDDRYYVVAGHNHASILEVRGLDDFKRAEGEFEITQADIEANIEWQREMVGFRSREAARIIDIYTLDSMTLGRLWEVLPKSHLPVDPQNPGRSVSFQIGRDETAIHARFEVVGAGPFRNSAAEWEWLFRGGAAVDLMIGLDPDAAPDRRAPVQGDKRIVVAMHEHRPVAVLYDAIAADAPAGSAWETATPAGGRTAFDAVRRIEDARITVHGISGGYAVELAVPMVAIGIDPDRHRRIRLDWGILETDEQGSNVLRRSYWSNQAVATVADAPTEARLEPNLWGWALLQGRDRSRPTMTDLLEPAVVDPADIDALLEGW